MSESEYIENQAQAYAGKFIAEHTTERDGKNVVLIDDTSDERMEHIFSRCVMPAKKHLYPRIREIVETEY